MMLGSPEAIERGKSAIGDDRVVLFLATCLAPFVPVK
jgi:hypothetical protein